ncbi:MAG: hypothetical protein EOM25_00950 [Deltaproteobacteria bacterium]|nr:hypothetical protein [Deltaproteobacteria bacterium]
MNRILFLLPLVVVLLLGACATRPEPGFKVPQGMILAVAPFTQPRHMGQLLAGYVPEDQPLVGPTVLTDLDADLESLLLARLGRNFLGTTLTRQCVEIVDRDISSSRVSALDYWLQVGRCLSADYMLVPQLFEWGERAGGQWGSAEPAKVVLDMFLIGMADESVRRFHFDEAQIALSQNILEAPTFVRRGGKWLTARELAGEGIHRGLEDLGL